MIKILRLIGFLMILCLNYDYQEARWDWILVGLENFQTQDTVVDYKPEDYMDYDIESTHSRFNDQDKFQLVISKDLEDEMLRDVKVFVSSKDSSHDYRLRQVIDIDNHNGAAYDSKGLHLYDINFDGHLDLLVFNGHYGNVGTMTYSAYVNIKDVYVFSESFLNIRNAAIDLDREEILSTWRDGVNHHGYSKYKAVEDGFELSETLSILWDENQHIVDDDDPIVEYTLTTYTDGHERDKTVYGSSEGGIETLRTISFDDDTPWAIYHKKWMSFNYRPLNEGTLIDYLKTPLGAYWGSLDPEMMDVNSGVSMIESHMSFPSLLNWTLGIDFIYPSFLGQVKPIALHVTDPSQVWDLNGHQSQLKTFDGIKTLFDQGDVKETWVMNEDIRVYYLDIYLDSLVYRFVSDQASGHSPSLYVSLNHQELLNTHRKDIDE